MAKLDRMPDIATIIGFRKKVDFYLWKGIPVARSWPRFTPYQFSQAQIEAQENFRAAVAWTGAIDPFLAEAYKIHSVGVPVTWIDAQRATALGKPWVELSGDAGA